MSKKKLNTNGTLLNLLLLGGAAVILKKRTGSLRGVGAIGRLSNEPIRTKDQLIEYLDKRMNSLERNMKYYKDGISNPNITKEEYDYIKQQITVNGYLQEEIFALQKLLIY